MWLNMKFKTIRWKWVEPIEAPKVVHLVTREMLKKSNIYAQITVRIHSKQVNLILYIYHLFPLKKIGCVQIPSHLVLFSARDKCNAFSCY